MKLRWIFLLCIGLSTAVHAFDTYRIGSRLIRTGDSVSEHLRTAIQQVLGILLPQLLPSCRALRATA